MHATEMPAFALTPKKIHIGRWRVRGLIPRGFLVLWIAALCAALRSCAPFMANHESEVQFKTVKTPAGPLRLAVIERGQGRPILLLHGFATSSYTWHAITPELAKTHPVIAIHLRGFCAS